MSSDAELQGDLSPSRVRDAVLLRDVVFRYGKREPVLRIPELRIGLGESVFLYGPSGSGKSTLLSLVAGVLQSTAGTVQVLDQAFDKASAATRDRVRGSRMGYVFQSFNLIPYLSVRQNILLPCELYRERLRHMREGSLHAEVERLAQRLDISALLDERPSTLSVGQQQRVAIARALIGYPALLIADEPTSSLDANRRDEFVALLLEMVEEARQQGNATTLLYVSHDMGLASHFSRTLSLSEINQASQPEGGRAAA
ncbi:ABC transporter ATP-binding protein [Terriglobus aquaticus]|uniref:ABC transporter ATP-binding protein n=1 Tax=Terriglobus aquaticus TaxID=940139 RepID=A0ABW9KLC9_9BACT|nr:ABC transporter ATP-binding protein [Terriglobus aquaticus]